MHPAFYLLSSEKKYTDYFDFIVLKNPHEQIKKQLNVKNLPKLILLWQNINDFNPNKYKKL